MKTKIILTPLFLLIVGMTFAQNDFFYELLAEANGYFHQGDFTQAKETYERASFEELNGPNGPQEQYNIQIKMNACTKLNLAKQNFRNCNKGYARVFQEFASQSLAVKNYNQAAQKMDKAEKAMNNGFYEEALTSFNALKSNPVGNPICLQKNIQFCEEKILGEEEINKAINLFNNNQLENANSIFSNFPKNPESDKYIQWIKAIKKADLVAEKGNFDQSFNAYRSIDGWAGIPIVVKRIDQLAENKQAFIEPLKVEAKSSFKTGNLDNAIRIYENILVQSPSENNIKNELHEAQKLNESVKAFQRLDTTECNLELNEYSQVFTSFKYQSDIANNYLDQIKQIETKQNKIDDLDDKANRFFQENRFEESQVIYEKMELTCPSDTNFQLRAKASRRLASAKRQYHAGKPLAAKPVFEYYKNECPTSKYYLSWIYARSETNKDFKKAKQFMDDAAQNGLKEAVDDSLRLANYIKKRTRPQALKIEPIGGFFSTSIRSENESVSYNTKIKGIKLGSLNLNYEAGVRLRYFNYKAVGFAIDAKYSQLSFAREDDEFQINQVQIPVHLIFHTGTPKKKLKEMKAYNGGRIMLLTGGYLSKPFKSTEGIAKSTYGLSGGLGLEFGGGLGYFGIALMYQYGLANLFDKDFAFFSDEAKTTKIGISISIRPW